MNTQIYSIIHTIFFTNIYSDIGLCQILYTNIFGYSFVLKFSQMSHSELAILVNLVVLVNLVILVSLVMLWNLAILGNLALLLILTNLLINLFCRQKCKYKIYGS